MPEDSFGEKTEDATPRKLQKARDEGQVAKSMEVPAVVVVLSGVFAIKIFAFYLYRHIEAIMREYFVFDRIPSINVPYCMTLMHHLEIEYLIILAPIFLALLFAGLASNYFQVGFEISWQAIEPKFSKLDPIKGFANKFSSRSVVELIKSIFKIIVISFVSYSTIKNRMDEVFHLYDHSIGYILIFILKVAFVIFLRVLLILALMAFFDLAFQKWKFAKDQMMSRPFDFSKEDAIKIIAFLKEAYDL